MKKIIVNANNLNEEEMTDLARKVKILLINSHNEYQFPGGTQEPPEIPSEMTGYFYL